MRDMGNMRSNMGSEKFMTTFMTTRDMYWKPHGKMGKIDMSVINIGICCKALE